jgi:hypothetical protein
VHKVTNTLARELIQGAICKGSGSWSLSKEEENLLQIFERRILRRIYGPINEGGIWRIRYNNGLYKLYNEPDTE